MLIIATIFHWLQLNYVEFAATLSGMLYVILAIKQKKILWLFGNLSSGLFVLVFYHAGLFAYGTLYVGYVIIGIYGWYNWSRKITDKPGKKRKISVRKTTSRRLLAYIFLSVLLTAPIYLILKKYADSDLLLPDAMLTATGLVATYMLTQKLIEQWLFWIVIDLFSSIVMIYKGLYPSFVLFMVYTLLAVKGFFEWKKELVTTA
jgi:nicotinamide mononucleotide transporter